MTLTTPAILFPAISLLLLAYTNRLGTSLILLTLSLVISFREIQISCVAINIELQDLRTGK